MYILSIWLQCHNQAITGNNYAHFPIHHRRIFWANSMCIIIIYMLRYGSFSTVYQNRDFQNDNVYTHNMRNNDDRDVRLRSTIATRTNAFLGFKVDAPFTEHLCFYNVFMKLTPRKDYFDTQTHCTMYRAIDHDVRL